MKISAELFAKGIIAGETNEKPSYQKIIEDFEVQLDLADSLEKLQEHCQNFLDAIASPRGGLAKNAADKLRDGWKNEGIQL